ncbi:MAG TPA: hypothetical protein VF171_09295 [Trueperaceae bacterium]
MDAFDSFVATHDRYLQVMDRAYAEADPAALEPFLDPRYHGYFAATGMERAEFFGYRDALEGMRQSAGAMPGVRTHCLHRTVQMRSASEALVFYLKRMIHEGRLRAYAFEMESWTRASGKWRLLREIVELGRPEA